MVNPIASAGGKAGGFFKGLGRFGGGIFSKTLGFVSQYFRIVLTVLALATVIISGISQSIEEKSFAPFVIEVGGRILSADEIIYQQVIEDKGYEVEIYQFEANPGAPFGYNSAARLGLWFRNMGQYVSLYWNIFVNIWIIYIVFKMFFKIYGAHNDSEKFWNGMFAVITMIMLQMYFGQLLAINAIADGEIPLEEVERNRFVYGVPFKGVVSLVLNAPKLLSPTKILVEQSLIAKPPDDKYNIGGDINVSNTTGFIGNGSQSII